MMIALEQVALTYQAADGELEALREASFAPPAAENPRC